MIIIASSMMEIMIAAMVVMSMAVMMVRQRRLR
jgi:hypothetical protein